MADDRDDLAEALAGALNERWPGVGDGLTRKVSNSALGTPLFGLHWTGGPAMGDVRAFLDHSEYNRVSVMFDRRD